MFDRFISHVSIVCLSRLGEIVRLVGAPGRIRKVKEEEKKKRGPAFGVFGVASEEAAALGVYLLDISRGGGSVLSLALCKFM